MGQGARWGLAKVRGHSMTPTLVPGDRLLVRYDADPVPGDVVVARFPDGVLAVKRVVREDRHHSGAAAWLLGSDNRTAPGARRAPVRKDAVLGVVRLRLWPRPGRIRRPDV
jgi:phage repressor protein C with HTH and peptisase S24 domain